MIDWSIVKHFKPEEWVKDPDKVAPEIVLLLDNMRDAAGVPFIIHVAWDDDGHVTGSSHYTLVRDECVAVDFHIVGWSLLDQWLFAERYPWSGIGLYPYWSNPGLHVDMRRLGRDHPNLGKRWWRDQDGSYRFIDLDFIKFLVRRKEQDERSALS